MEVTFHRDNLGAVSRNTFPVVPPAAGQLECGLHRLHPTVHGQHLIIPEISGDILCKLAEQVTVERTGSQRKPLCLFGKCTDNPRVTMPLVDRRIPGKEVVITLTIDVPQIDALAPLQYYGQGMIVMRAVL